MVCILEFGDNQDDLYDVKGALLSGVVRVLRDAGRTAVALLQGHTHTASFPSITSSCITKDIETCFSIYPIYF